MPTRFVRRKRSIRAAVRDDKDHHLGPVLELGDANETSISRNGTTTLGESRSGERELIAGCSKTGSMRTSEILKEKLLEFPVISVSMLQGVEDAACRSQQQPPAQTRSELAARARSELRRISDVPQIDPISCAATAMRRSQQKVQPACRMKISRDRECDEPQVVRVFPDNRQGQPCRGGVCEETQQT